MRINRRQVLRGTAAAGLALVAPTGWSSHAVGTATIATCSDGHLVVPPPVALGADTTAAPTERPCNITVVRHGDRTVVFDVGAGPNFMPSAGDLVDNLAELEIDIDAVTDVLFTHAHPDHFWGVLDDFDEPLFPNARYAMHRVERDWWLDPATLNALPENRQVFASAAKRLVRALDDRLEVFEVGQEVALGIEALATPGHTPGHTSFVIHSGSERAVVLGDAVVDEAVSFTHPGVPLRGDVDPALASETRTRLLTWLADQKTMLSGFHLTGGGLGYAVRDGAGRFRFDPV